LKGRVEEVRKGNKIIGYRIVIEMPRMERYQDGKTAGRTKKRRLVRSMRGRSFDEAYAEMQRPMADESVRELGPSPKTPLGEYLKEWLNLKMDLAPKTRQGYEINIRLHITPILGMVKLGSVKPPQIQRLYKNLLDKGESAGTVRYVHATLHAALEQARKHRVIPFNPASVVDPPSPDTEESAALASPKDVAAFLDVAKESTIYELLVLAVHAGMRRGELLALRWESIDLDTGLICVCRALSRVKGVWHIKKTKEKHEKYVVVGQSALDLLKALRERNPRDLVFCHGDGKMLDPDTVSDEAAAVLDKAGFPDVTLHGLRHTNATILRASGVDAAMIQKRLGHHSLGMTETYMHINYPMQKQVADLFDGLLGHQKGTNLPQDGNSSTGSDPRIH
jgi:integrase